MSDAELLRRLREAAQKATPGPWRHVPHHAANGELKRDSISVERGRYDWQDIIDDVANPEDAPHIANCDPQNILGLCETIDRLTAELAAVTAERDEARAHDVRTMKPNDIAIALPCGEHDRLKRLIEGLALQAASAERERDEARAEITKIAAERDTIAQREFELTADLRRIPGCQRNRPTDHQNYCADAQEAREDREQMLMALVDARRDMATAERERDEARARVARLEEALHRARAEIGAANVASASNPSGYLTDAALLAATAIDTITNALEGQAVRKIDDVPFNRAIVEKQTKNEARAWPDWRTADPHKAIEHVRTHEGKP